MDRMTATVILPDNFSKEVANTIIEQINPKLATQTYPPYMNLKQAADYVGVSFTTVKKWIELYPNFPVKNIGGSYHINRRALDKFMLSK